MVDAFRPADLAQALQIMADTNPTLLAGGTDLMVRHKTWSGVVPHFEGPVLLIGHLPELQGIEIRDQRLFIGSAVTLAAILEHPLVPDHIKSPIAQMASAPIRNLATLGGNICNASPAGDSLPMLYALDAGLHLESVQGQQTVTIQDYITGPGRTRLNPGQLLTAIEIPLIKCRAHYYRKVGQRQANSISKVSFYAAADYDNQHIDWVRIALGAVAPTVVRIPAAEGLLAGLDVSELKAAIPAVINKYQELLSPVDDVRSTQLYRREVSLRLLDDYLTQDLLKKVSGETSP